MIAVRYEHTIPGAAWNYGHDDIAFGLFVNDKHTVATRNRAASMLMEHGSVSHTTAYSILDMVEQGIAFDVHNGTTQVL